MTTHYKPFLMRKLKDDSPVKDSLEWNVLVKHVPFKVYPDMADISKRTWLDKSGDEEFLPDSPSYKAYSMDCEFVFKGEHGTANSNIKLFIEYLAEGGMFSFYDTYAKLGRTKVRYESFDPDMMYRRDGKNDIVIFKVSLKVNDPITDIILAQ